MTSNSAQDTTGPLLYVGTYTGTKSKGIYAFRLDAKGKLTPLGLAAETTSPTFLAVHPNKKFLYAANEMGSFAGKRNTGAVSAFKIDRQSGKLTLLNQQPSGGGGPCHLVVDETGKWVLAANYGGGSIIALPVKKDGSLGEATAFIQHEGSSVNKQRQERPHAHCISTDPANRFALTCDLGLDKVLVYKFDSKKGTLTPNDPAFASVAPGAGPRHLAFSPNGKFVYVNNEMGNTVTVFAWQPKKGTLTEIQTLPTLPDDFKGSSSTAEIEVHPSGQFVYVSNRGHDSIAAFAANPKTGKLAPIQHEPTQGKNPRHFAIDPTGKYLIAQNQNSDSIVVFQIDPKTGQLAPTGQTVETGSPVCIKFVK